MTFQNHLKEILYRIFYLTLSFFLVFLILYGKKEKALKILISSVHKDFDLQTIALFESFLSQIQISFSCSFFLIIPFIIYHIWQFLIPALYKSERYKFSKICFYFSFYTFLSFLYGFFYFPSFLCFLSKFTYWTDNPYFLIQIRLTDFLNTYLTTQGFLIVYIGSILIILYFSMWIPSNLSKIRPWISLFFICLSAFISTSDLVSQLIITFIFLIHYEILVFLNFFFKQYLNFIKLKKEIHPPQDK